MNDVLQNNHIGFIYKEPITKKELEKLKEDYYIFFNSKIENKEYSEQEINRYLQYIIFVSSKIMEMDSAQQNKVSLYLFNAIDFKIKSHKNLDNIEQMF